MGELFKPKDGESDLQRRSREIDEIAAASPFVVRIRREQRRARIRDFFIALGLTLDLVVTAGAIRDYVHQRALDHRTAALVVELQRNSESLHEACLSRNVGRANQVKLWTQTILSSKPPANETPAAKRERIGATVAFYQRLRTIFAPEKCPPA